MTHRDSGEPWKTESWFVSPWNYLEELKRDDTPPSAVKVHDTTLRDGEQQTGLMFTIEDKLRIAEKLAEVGVHRIEAGTPTVSPQDETAVREIVRRKFGPEIFCLTRCMVDDVRRAADCGVDGIIIEIPSSEHLIELGYRWPLQKAMDLPIEATRAARDAGLYTAFFTVDASRADMEWLLSLLKHIAAEGHMDSLVLVDTFGVLSPRAARYYTKRVKEHIDKPLEAHFHSDFRMGVANTTEAVLAGAEVIHTTVNGLGERAGNAPLTETVLALRTLYGIDTGIDYGKLRELAKLVEQVSGVPMPANRPFIGDSAYQLESGMAVEWYRNAGVEADLELFPIHPSFVGNVVHPPALGKKSGRANVAVRAEQLGFQLTKEQIGDALRRVKAKGYEKGRLLTEAEFGQILKEATAR